MNEDILEYHIQKLTLQPIVENAIYHGIKNKRGGGKITVEGDFQGDDIIFRVRDNGIGMKEEELTKFRDYISGKIELDNSDKNKSGSGFGMANVEKRIEMMYGPDYGVTVESKYNEGTIVTVLIPKT